jgi:mRNA-degrading endonuclease RelE of RelBE toxin-antitoxin system
LNEVTFIETSVFTRLIVESLGDEDYWAFQFALLFRPELGSVIPGSGGLRKIRWAAQGRGKRGGIRVIYYWHEPCDPFYLLYVYRKNERDDITTQQLRVLSRLVREEFG